MKILRVSKYLEILRITKSQNNTKFRKLEIMKILRVFKFHMMLNFIGNQNNTKSL